jgi:2-methylaconitate cis-trans-isomerase PrpF
MANQESSDQVAVRCTLIRGGTSKGLYFHEADVPAAGPARDRFLRRVMGSPDVMQIDGLGGSRLVTSKVAIIKRSARSDADVDYTFAQIDVERAGVDYDGNCGNISSGVGPFAIDEGLVKPVEPVTKVRVYNTNTQKILITHVPVAGGKARVTGSFAIAGVPGSGAEIIMDYSGTVGAKSGKMLPTGNVTDAMALEDGLTATVTLCDVANPCVFVHAREVGLSGSELPQAIMGNKEALARIYEIQGKARKTLGFVDDWRLGSQVVLPLFVMVAEPADYVDMRGTQQKAADMDLRARLLFVGKCHESMADTGSMCTAAASRIPGSVVNRVLPAQSRSTGSLRIGHPLGVMHVKVQVEETTASGSNPKFQVLGFGRTARRLMDGVVYVPRADFN